MDAAAKRQAIQAIMKDTSLTPQEKQKKMLELNKAATPTKAPAPTTPTTPTRVESVEKQPVTTSPTKQASSEPNKTVPEPNPAAEQAANNKRFAIQEIMKDKSLTPLERQAKIQKLMKEETPAPTASSSATPASAPSSNSGSTTLAAAPIPAPSAVDDNRQVIQSIMRHDSWDPRKKQKKLKEAMAAKGTTPAATAPTMNKGGTTPTPAATSTTATTLSTPTNTTSTGSESSSKSNHARQALVQALMRDTTLSPQEKQKRIKAITQRETTGITPAAATTPKAEEPHTWGSPTAALKAANKPKQEETTPPATPSKPTTKVSKPEEKTTALTHTFGSPTTAATVVSKETKQNENETFTTPSKQDKAKAALAARMSMGALSPTAVLTSATPPEDDFSHIRRPAKNDDTFLRPDPKGNRKSMIGQPDSTTSSSAAKTSPPKAAVSPGQSALKKNPKYSGKNIVAGAVPTPAPTKPAEKAATTAAKAPAPVSLSAKNSLAVHKAKAVEAAKAPSENEPVETKKEENDKPQSDISEKKKEENDKPQKKQEESREPASTSRALPGLSEEGAAPAAATSRGLAIPTEPDPAQAGCCIVM